MRRKKNRVLELLLSRVLFLAEYEPGVVLQDAYIGFLHHVKREEK